MRARWLSRLLLPVLRRRVADARSPDFEVGPVDGPYLRRWFVWPRNGWCNMYLHNMLRDDDDVLHDHPYWSLSLVLTDGLEEVYCEDPISQSAVKFEQSGTGNYDAKTATLRNSTRMLRTGQVVWRSSVFAHQLVVRDPAWTLFLTGPRVREWGFWCPRGWRPWQQYVRSDSDGKRSLRGGCGE